MRDSLRISVPGYTALPSERLNDPNAIVLIVEGYRNSDLSKKQVILKIFQGGIQPCTIADHERYLLRRFADGSSFVVKLLKVSHIIPSFSTCSVLEKWGPNVCELAVSPNSSGVIKLELQRQVGLL